MEAGYALAFTGSRKEDLEGEGVTGLQSNIVVALISAGYTF